MTAAAVLVNYLDGENCQAIASVAEGCFASRLLTACRAVSEESATSMGTSEPPLAQPLGA